MLTGMGRYDGTIEPSAQFGNVPLRCGVLLHPRRCRLLWKLSSPIVFARAVHRNVGNGRQKGWGKACSGR
jgi:hypothetical protein